MIREKNWTKVFNWKFVQMARRWIRHRAKKNFIIEKIWMESGIFLFRNKVSQQQQQQCDQMAWFIFNIGPFITKDICPKAYQFTKRWRKYLPNTNLGFYKLPKDFQNIAKLTKFFQIWSHWATATTATIDKDEMLMPLAYIPGRRSSNVGQFKVGWKFSLGFLNWVILGLFLFISIFSSKQ